MKLLAFIVVGSLNTLLGIAVYGGLLRLGLPFPIASGFSLLVGIIVGFHAHGRLVFRARGMFLRYLGVWVAIYAFANGMIWFLQRYMSVFLAGVASTPLNAGLAFLALRQFVYQGHHANGPPSSGASAP